jgi:DAK2 domain fusion protein YloV
MMATVRAALAEAEALGPSASAERIASAAAFGALMGARGNSGVITSQVMRGIAEGLAGKTRFNALDLANALDQGTKAAYGAVAKPVEGTILTVTREASAAAVEIAERDRSLDAVLRGAVEAAEDAVARTPSLLPILREAGVVDSGGQGLFRLMEGALAFLEGTAPEANLRPSTVAPAHGPAAHGAVPHAPGGAHGAPPGAGMREEGFGYETIFLLRARHGESLDVDAIRAHLESIGESVMVAGDTRAVKVHVHNERPDEVLGYALGLGTLSMIGVENLDAQAEGVREARAAAFAGDGSEAPTADAREAPSGSSGVASGGGEHGVSSGAAEEGEPAPTPPPPAADARNGTGSPIGDTTPPGEPLPLAVVAVAAGEGLAAIFRDFGVHGVVMGGQSANPSTGELLAAVTALNAREVLVLPNNPNVVMAARQVAQMTDRTIGVVATRNAAEGFAALLALDPSKGADENAAEMTAAGRGIQTLAVTEAVRDATIGGRKVKRGQTIVLDPDEGLLACHDKSDEAVLAAIRALEPGFELLTVYYGDGADLAGTEALARRIHDLATGAEVEVVHGGQPHYRYLISAE